MGLRYTAFDANEGTRSDRSVQKALRTLGDVWEVQAEQTLYRMQDAAPQALAELLAALRILKGSALSSEEVAQIAISFRRTLEKLTRQYCPPTQPNQREKPGWVKEHWKAYAEKNREKLGAYADVILSEADGLDDSVGRLGPSYRMGHKGVHENWDVGVFRSIALRLILLTDDLMMVGPERRGVQLERDFLSMLGDEE